MTYRERPSGHLGLLYDEVSSYTNQPIQEIERIAREVFKTETIDRIVFEVLARRVPLSTFNRETLQSVGDRLCYTKQGITVLERKAYSRLSAYIRRVELELEGTNILDLEIDMLPWDYSFNSAYALNTLKKFFGRTPTVGEVVELFSNLNKTQQSIVGFRSLSQLAVSKTFSKVGIELPAIT